MKRWLLRKIKAMLEDDVAVKDIGCELPRNRGDSVLNFRVYPAVGGKVVEFTCYDQKTERNSSTVYIITNEQDFGERIAKIATMENLKA